MVLKELCFMKMHSLAETQCLGGIRLMMGNGVKKIRKELAGHLKTLQTSIVSKETGRREKWNKASPFYALLIADGDSLGKLLGEFSGEQVSSSLAKFGEFVSSMDKEGDHVTIYAGGDDYLGLFPLADVFEAALLLRKAYLDAFKAVDPDGKATLSTAIIFAHYSNPLSSVIKQGHHFLDDIAKEKNGRDSISVNVAKSSGEIAGWVSKWENEQGFTLQAFI